MADFGQALARAWERAPALAETFTEVQADPTQQALLKFLVTDGATDGRLFPQEGEAPDAQQLGLGRRFALEQGVNLDSLLKDDENVFGVPLMKWRYRDKEADPQMPGVYNKIEGAGEVNHVYENGVLMVRAHIPSAATTPSREIL